MMIRFKNKMTLALQGMIERAAQAGGIPSHIELSEQEGKNLLEELNFISKEVPSNLAAFRFVLDGHIVNFERLLKLHPINTHDDIVMNWKSKRLTVSYMRIDMTVIDPAPEDKKYHS